MTEALQVADPTERVAGERERGARWLSCGVIPPWHSVSR